MAKLPRIQMREVQRRYNSVFALVWSRITASTRFHSSAHHSLDSIFSAARIALFIFGLPSPESPTPHALMHVCSPQNLGSGNSAGRGNHPCKLGIDRAACHFARSLHETGITYTSLAPCMASTFTARNPLGNHCHGHHVIISRISC